MAEDEIIEGRAESWNVAAANAYDIFNKKVECQELIKICRFGSANFGEHYDEDVKAISRKEAMERLLLNYRFIITSSRGFVDKKSKQLQIKIKEDIELIEKNMTAPNGTSLILKKNEDYRNKRITYELIQPHYDNCLKKVIEMFDDLVISIKGILGRITDEIDLETLKQQIIEGG